MLYIIYCKPDKNQGKKEFMRVLENHFAVIPIRKYTNKPKGSSVDPNLIYLKSSKISNRDEFLHAINDYNCDSGKSYSQDTLYIYERKKDGETVFYGIPQDDIFTALKSDKNYALVCTNITIISNIKNDAKANEIYHDISNHQRMLAYCLVRQESEDQGSPERENSLTIKELKDLYGGREREMPHWLSKYSDETQTIILPYGEARELDFFRYISEFSNLLIIKNYGNFDRDKAQYVEDTIHIIERYIGLKPIKNFANSKQRVFVVHTMSTMKFKFIDDRLNNMIVNGLSFENADLRYRKMLYLLYGDSKKYSIRFAQDIQREQTHANNRTMELTQTILEEIDNSDIVIGDLRGINQNCLYEIGYAYSKRNKINVLLTAPKQEINVLKDVCFDIYTMTRAHYDLTNIINTINDFIRNLGLEENFKINCGQWRNLVFNIADDSVTFDKFIEDVKLYEEIIYN